MSDIKETERRFSGAPWFNSIKKYNIHIIGLGTIGSWTALNIARLNPEYINIFDSDTIEKTNLAGQLYPTFDIGMRKNNSLRNIIEAFSEYSSIGVKGHVDHHTSIYLRTTAPNIIITGVDSMAARKSIWNNIENTQLNAETLQKDCWLIDGRMSAEGLQIITVNLRSKTEVEYYKEHWLYDSSEVTRGDVCSYKQTSFIGSIIGGLITNIVVNIATNNIDPELRTIPQVLQYTAEDLVFSFNPLWNDTDNKEL